MTKIKICGVTNTEDATWAANLGADFVGLNFYPQSPRKASAKNAAQIAAALPPFTPLVGVFVNEPQKSLEKIVKSVGLQWAQLHGDESPETAQAVKALGVHVIKAFRLQAPIDAAMLAPYEPYVDYFMFDAYVPDVPGGTGKMIAQEFLEGSQALQKPWILSGGLQSDNVADLIKRFNPAMVDVCSGVERSPTRKDYDAMKAFIQNVRAAK